MSKTLMMSKVSTFYIKTGSARPAIMECAAALAVSSHKTFGVERLLVKKQAESTHSPVDSDESW